MKKDGSNNKLNYETEYKKFYQIFYNHYYQIESHKIINFEINKLINPKPIKKATSPSIIDDCYLKLTLGRDITENIEKCAAFLQDIFRVENNAYGITTIFNLINEEIIPKLITQDDTKKFIECCECLQNDFDKDKRKGTFHDDIDNYLEKLDKISISVKQKQTCLMLLEKESTLAQKSNDAMQVQKDQIKACWDYFCNQIINEMSFFQISPDNKTN